MENENKKITKRQLAALDAVIDMAGGQMALAKKLKRTQAAISQWRSNGPAIKMVPKLVELSGGIFDYNDFRPDIFKKTKKT